MHDDQRQPPRAIVLFCTLPVAPAANLDSWGDLNQTVFSRRQMNASRQQEAGDGLYVPAAQPASRAKGSATCPAPAFWRYRIRRIGNQGVWYLRSPHELILIELWSSLCPSSSTYAKNATTSSKRWCMAKKKRNAPSATPPSSIRNSQSSRSQRRDLRPEHPQPVEPVDRAAILAARAPARSGI